MKVVFNITLILYLINVSLYSEFMLGVFAQFFLGLSHILTALILLVRSKALTGIARKNLKIYSSIVVLYFGLMALFKDSSSQLIQDFAVMYLSLVPMLIGAYFVYVTFLAQTGIKASRKISDKEEKKI